MHAHAENSAPGSGHERRRANQGRLFAVLALAAVYAGVEVVGAQWTGSLALLADAGHMLSDSAALVLALFALWVARRPRSARGTFGHTRAEILAALANGAVLTGVAIYIAIEAFRRFAAPPKSTASACSGLPRAAWS